MAPRLAKLSNRFQQLEHYRRAALLRARLGIEPPVGNELAAAVVARRLCSRPGNKRLRPSKWRAAGLGMELLSNPLTLILAVLAVIVLGLAKGGFSGLGALATPLLALSLPPVTAAALLLPVLLVQDVVSVWIYRTTWDRWVVGWMLPGAAVGVALAALVAAAAPEARLLFLLGAITLAFALYRLWIERGGRLVAASNSPGWVGSLFGMASGFTSQIAHAGGPPFQMWVTPRHLPHQTFVGTSSITFAAINLMKVPSYSALGSFSGDLLVGAAMLMPLAVAATLAGAWLVRRIDGQRFYSLIYLLMVAVGLRLVWQGLA